MGSRAKAVTRIVCLAERDLWCWLVDHGVPTKYIDGQANQCYLICISIRFLGLPNRGLSWTIKTVKTSPSIPSLDLVYRPRTPWMKGRLTPLGNLLYCQAITLLIFLLAFSLWAPVADRDAVWRSGRPLVVNHNANSEAFVTKPYLPLQVSTLFLRFWLAPGPE